MKRILTILLAALLLTGCAAPAPAATAPTTTIKTHPTWNAQADTSAFPLMLTFAVEEGETWIQITPDGWFEGVYNAGEVTTDEDTGISSGKVRHCKFSGVFDTLTKVDDYTYLLMLGEWSTQRAIGETWNENGVSYTACDAYGIVGGKEFRLYVPGTPEDKLPAEVLQVAVMRETQPRTLEGYCLYNVATQQVLLTAKSE